MDRPRLARKPNRRRRAVLAALWLCCVFIGWVPRASAAAEEDPTLIATLLEHKLAYLAADYAMAASSTAAGEESEGDEHMKLADELERMVGRLPLSAALARQVVDVSVLVRRSASASTVGAAVEEARAILIANFRIPVAPSSRPDAAHGRALFEQYCAPCHGMSGHADTERAATLKPRPADFLDPSIGEPLSPYRITTTVRFGVDGTAMVPFGFLTDADRWDVAFYALGLRHVAPSKDEGPLYELSELAILSDGELRADLRASGVEAALVEPVLTELRRQAPYQSGARRDSLALARAQLALARAAAYRGDRERAVAAACQAETEGFLPAEPAIRSLDHLLVYSGREAFNTVVTRTLSSAPARQVHLSIAAALRTDLRAKRALWHTYRGFSPASSEVDCALVLALHCLDALALVVALLAVVARAGVAHENKKVQRGFILALPLGAAASWPFFGKPAIPAEALDATLGALSLLVGCGLLYLGWTFLNERTNETSLLRRSVAGAGVLLFLVTFGATFRDAMEEVLFFRSLLACGVGARAMLVGLGFGATALALLGVSYGALCRRLPLRASLRVSLALLTALSVLFLAEAIVAFYPVVTL
jgi:high-affinity iron transporter